MIAKITTNISKWNKVLQSVEYAVNNTVCRSTNATPSMLLFGIHQNNGSDDNLREALETIIERKRDLPTIRQQASLAIEALQRENKQTYNRKRKTPNLYNLYNL